MVGWIPSPPCETTTCECCGRDMLADWSCTEGKGYQYCARCLGWEECRSKDDGGADLSLADIYFQHVGLEPEVDAGLEDSSLGLFSLPMNSSSDLSYPPLSRSLIPVSNLAPDDLECLGDPKVVQMFVRHSTIGLTMDRYTHLPARR